MAHQATVPWKAMAWIVVLICVLTAIGWGPGFSTANQALLHWVTQAGPWGPVILAVVYVPAAVLMIPGSVLTLAAGYAFGLTKGLLAVSVGSTAGACAAFVISRYLARDWVAGQLGRRVALASLDSAVAKEGFKLVLLIRLSPLLPYVVANYVLGLTKIRLRTFALASWIGMLPGGLLYVYLGTVARGLGDVLSGRLEAGPWTWTALILGLIATAIVGVWLARMARDSIQRAGALVQANGASGVTVQPGEGAPRDRTES